MCVCVCVYIHIHSYRYTYNLFLTFCIFFPVAALFGV